jgi:hypothetical protein
MDGGRLAMTQEELKKLYGAFFKAEGLVAKWGFLGPYYVIVMYEDYDYNVVLDTKRNHGGTCFQMFTRGPEFVIWEDSPDCWENDPELEGKVQDAANRVNARHILGRVNADDSEVTYSVDIPLQSPEQFKDFFYKAAYALKAVEQDFIDELRNIGLIFWEPSSEPWETGERIINELCAKQGFISGSDGKSCLKALGNDDTIEVEYRVYDRGIITHISHYPTGISRVHEAAASSTEGLYFYRGEFSADEDMARVKETIAFEEEAAAGNFETADEQEEAGGLQ